MVSGADVDEPFTEYVGARWARLVRSAVLLGGRPADAEDLVQTALTKVYRRWDRVARADDRDAYVYRVLLNTLTDSRRRRWAGERPTADLPEPPVPDETERVATRDAVRRALAALGEDQRAVVVLRYYAHLSEAQMAEVLGVAPGTVKSRLSRALAAMRCDPVLAGDAGAGE